jgi:hypothetical protein
VHLALQLPEERAGHALLPPIAHLLLLLRGVVVLGVGCCVGCCVWVGCCGCGGGCQHYYCGFGGQTVAVVVFKAFFLVHVHVQQLLYSF